MHEERKAPSRTCEGTWGDKKQKYYHKFETGLKEETRVETTSYQSKKKIKKQVVFTILSDLEVEALGEDDERIVVIKKLGNWDEQAV